MWKMAVVVSIWLIMCGIAFPLRADLNGDCRVDIDDLAILMSEWMQEDEDCLMGLGSELITNGTFDTDTDWFKSIGWTISDGKAHFLGSDSYEQIDQAALAGKLEIGKTYQIQIDFEVVQGNFSIIHWDGTSTSVSETQTVAVTKTLTEEQEFDLGVWNTSGMEGDECYLDNWSVREITGGSAMSGPEFMQTIEDEW